MNQKLTNFLTILGGLTGVISAALSIVKEMNDTYQFILPSWIVILLSLALVVTMIKLQWAHHISSWIEWLNRKIAHYRPTMILGVLVISLMILGISCYLMVSLRQVADLSGTRFVGRFPENMIEINKLVKEARNELIIVGDQIAYGAFSQPKEHSQYLSNLIEASEKNNFSTKIMSYETSIAKQAVKTQLGLKNDEDSLNPELKTKAKAWLELTENSYYDKRSPETVTDFVSLLAWKNESVRKTLSSRKLCLIKFLEEKVPVFFWMADGNRAVFSFYARDESNNPTEVSFFTNDANTIEILKLIYLNNWSKQ
ncbi:hypothetical protein [Prosthecobacter sp.]|uniref:hypothetical protein n=1 Tax=Prosthecobacter sp. TaxID=1965333 RepID=UPI003782FC20